MLLLESFTHYETWFGETAKLRLEDVYVDKFSPYWFFVLSLGFLEFALAHIFLKFLKKNIRLVSNSIFESSEFVNKFF